MSCFDCLHPDGLLARFFARPDEVAHTSGGPARHLRASSLLLVLVVAAMTLGGLCPAQAEDETAVPYGANWLWRKGTNEVSNPTSAWRTNTFPDTGWLSGPAPFHYNEGLTGGTTLSDMRNKYGCIFIRTRFQVTNVSEITAARFLANFDDGFIAWINGVEVARSTNVTVANPTYTNLATVAHEAAGVETFTITKPPASFLIAGTNMLATQVFNNNLNSSDLRFDPSLVLTKSAPDTTPPRLSSVIPPAGADVGGLTQVTVVFSEFVNGVNAADLLVNSLPATSVVGASGTNRYTFSFPQPPVSGSVNLTWSPSHGIVDLVGLPFDANAPGATWGYTLVPLAVTSTAPAAGATVPTLSQITVTFNGPVTGVAAEDLLVNGLPAVSLSGSGSVWTYFFTQPPAGSVQVSFDVNHTITDLLGNRFDQLRPGSSWQYTLADNIAPMLVTVLPAPGATVGALSRIELTFGEPVTGVDASDLLINGQAASQVTGAGAGVYTFLFSQPSPGTVSITWAAGQGIRDMSVAANPFSNPGWGYLLNSNAAFGDIVINEFLADNLTGLLDEDGQGQDWIELWNRGTNNVNLLGWSLTDAPEDPGRWTFPAVALNAGQYLVIYASAKDRKPTTPGAKLHTNFRLNAAGDYLGLYNSQLPRQPVSEFQPAFPEQRGDVSYGLGPGNAPAYFTSPTPGGPNNQASVVAGVVQPPSVSVKSGFFDQAFQVVLSTSTPGAEIRYTLDGSVPTSGSALYTGPLLVSGDSLRAVALLRAAAFRAAWLSSAVTTHTYIFPEFVSSQPAYPEGFPALWDSPPGKNDIPADYEMDPDIVNQGSNAAVIRDGLMRLPTLSIVTDVNLLFGPDQGVIVRREDWNQQPVTAEVILPDGSPGASALAGMEIQGGTSPLDQGTTWKSKKLSLRLVFKGDFGLRNLEYPLFEDSHVTQFNTLVFDNGLNYVWHYNGGSSTEDQRIRAQYVRDAFMSDLQKQISGTSAHWRYFHVYLNGLYWGITGLHERPDDKFAENYFGGEAAEYDVLRHNAGNIVAGNNVAYSQMFALARSGLTNATTYEALQQQLDLPWFIDYMLINYWAGNEDWDHQNWYACRRRATEGRWRYLSWDAEHVLKNPGVNRLTLTNSSSPTELFHLLRANSEFRVRFADHVHRHFFNNGTFAVSSSAPVPLDNPASNNPAALYLKRIREIDAAMVGESARWGDSGDYGTDRSNSPLTRDGDWVPELLALMGWSNATGHASSYNYFPNRSATVLNQLRNAALYPSVTAPTFNQHGGLVAQGFSLVLTAPTGTLYYTTNGLDPRAYGSGTVAPSAMVYNGPVPLLASVVIKARALSAGTWSALNEAAFSVGTLGAPLRLTEINYNPDGGSDAHEFVELQNIGPLPLEVGGFAFQRIDYAFPDGTVVAPGAVLILANNDNPAAFAARYPGVAVFGYFGGDLSDSGERLALLDRNGQTVTAVHYDDEGGWPLAADGGGCSLEIIDPRGDPNAPANWRASPLPHGTPGLPPAGTAVPGDVVLNEVMAENLTTIANGGAFPDWVELRNRGPASVNLALWSLTDDSNPRKFVFPAGTTLADGDLLIVWCDSATNSPGLHAGFALGRNGESLFLYDANTNRVDALTFGLQIADRSVGRIDDAWRLTQPTPGSNNVAAALAAVTNLVINEWLANAPPGGDDWVELFNRSSTAPVPLQGLYLAATNAVCQLQALSFLAPRGYAQLWADEQPGANHLEFKLPAAGGTLALRSDAAALLDQVSYGPQVEQVSQGRMPDGQAAITSFNGSASPGASNYLLAYSGPLLNEVLARNQRAAVSPWGNYADFVELYNPTAAGVSLAGMGLGASTDAEDRWVFPPGTSLGAGGWLRVWCDEARAASTAGSAALNTGFSLDGESGEVVLFNAIGQPVDWVSYGFQVRDFSIGRSGGTWHLLSLPTPGTANAIPAALGDATGLRINEWMAAGDGEDWFELYNTGDLPVSLSGFLLTDNPSTTGITNTPIAALSFIGSRDWVKWIADGNRSAGRNHANFALDAMGETIRLYASDRVLLDAVDFGLQSTNVSQGRLPDGAANVVAFATTPTPAAANYLPLTNVVINEVLTHTDPPLEDAVEVFNPTAGTVELGGWYLSDSQGDLKRFRIPEGTSLAPGGYRVFYQADFGPAEGEADTPPLFTFNSAHGDAVYLSEADAAGNLTGYRLGWTFGASTNGVSFGRHQTSVGVDFVALSQRTFGVDNPVNVVDFRKGTGAPNAYPRVGPLVVNEIMYHPPHDTNTLENPDEEFIELHNPSTSTVAMFDPAHPTNTWRLANAVTFTFPTNTSLAAGGYLLVVPFDPTTNTAAVAGFRARYGQQGALIGPYAGRLNNAGDSIELWRPDAPQSPPGADAGYVPYFLVDRVVYSDVAPWSAAADGGGASLQRLAPTLYGNDPVNWKADQSTAGRTNGPSAGESPIVLVPPQSRTNITGTSSEFTVVADGTAPLSYQWLFNGAPLLGRTATNLVLSPVKDTDAGEYRVQVTNEFGNILSAPATLTVWVPPAFLFHPASQTVNVGAGVAFTVTASGTAPLSYQWLRNGTVLQGQTAEVLELRTVGVGDAGSYRVVVTNVAGEAVSDAALLTVQSPPVITAHPSGAVVAIGSRVTLNGSATGDAPLTYQWRFQGTDLANATTATLTLNNLQPTNSGSYTLYVANHAGWALSDPAQLIVVEAPALVSPEFTVDGELLGWLVGPTNYLYRLEFSTNLLDWSELGTLHHTNTATPFLDEAAPGSPTRTYRARLLE